MSSGLTIMASIYDGRQRVTPSDITSDLRESLERLQTDMIDLYLLHRDDPSVPVGPLVEVLNEHQRAGNPSRADSRARRFSLARSRFR